MYKNPGLLAHPNVGVKVSRRAISHLLRSAGKRPYSGSGHWHWLIGTVWGQVHHPSASSMRIIPEYTLVLQAYVSLFPVEAGVEGGGRKPGQKGTMVKCLLLPPTFRPLGSQVSWSPRCLVMSAFPSQVLRRDWSSSSNPHLLFHL